MTTTTAIERAPAARVLTASLVGTAVEFYDFYIYATAAALVFGPLFFPAESASAQLMSSYATFAIAFLPTYQTAGWVAPLLLCVLRFGQGLGLGGEWGGAALLAVENAPPGWRARFGMFPQLGAPVGFIAANGLFLVLGIFLTQEDFLAWGWRIPFLLSVVLVGIGLWVRTKLSETPAFKAALEAERPPAVPLGELLKSHWRETLGGTFGVVACFCIYYLATAFALGYGTGALGYAREDFLLVQLGAILFMAGGIIWAGYWSDATTPRNVLMTGCALAAGAGFLLGPALASGSLLVIFAFLSLVLLLMGFVYGPLGAWLPGLFPARVRYTGASVAFNTGGIIGGGLTPMAAQALADAGGLNLVGMYLSVAAGLSLIALFLLRRPVVEE